MAKNEFYIQNEDGTTSIDPSRTINEPDAIAVLEGYADLKPTTGGARVTVLTPFAGNGNIPILTRVQNSGTAAGQVFIVDSATINGVSFEIRSTNSSDSGTIYWNFIQ